MIPRIRIVLALGVALLLSGHALPSVAAPVERSAGSRRVAAEQAAAIDAAASSAREPVAGAERASGDERQRGKDRTDGDRAGDRNRKKKPRCFGKRATVRAVGAELPALTAGNDTVLGDGAANEIGGSAGIDRVCAGNGDDEVDAKSEAIDRQLLARGGDGNDTLLGTDGDDRLFGDAGNDDLGGFRGRNELLGGKGDDSLATSGTDRLDGGPGDDRIRADDGNFPVVDADVVLGGEGDDQIFAADDLFDLIDCGSGNDAVEFDAGLDQLSANCETLTPVP